MALLLAQTQFSLYNSKETLVGQVVVLGTNWVWQSARTGTSGRWRSIRSVNKGPWYLIQDAFQGATYIGKLNTNSPVSHTLRQKSALRHPSSKGKASAWEWSKSQISNQPGLIVMHKLQYWIEVQILTIIILSKYDQSIKNSFNCMFNDIGAFSRIKFWPSLINNRASSLSNNW